MLELHKGTIIISIDTKGTDYIPGGGWGVAPLWTTKELTGLWFCLFEA